MEFGGQWATYVWRWEWTGRFAPTPLHTMEFGGQWATYVWRWERMQKMGKRDRGLSVCLM